MTQEPGVAAKAPKALEGEVQDVAHVLVLGAHSFACAEHMPFGQVIKYASADISAVEMWHHMLVKLVAGPKIQVGEDATGRPIMEPAAMEAVWDACDELGRDGTIKAIGELFDSYTAPTPTEPESPSANGQAAPDAT